MTTKAPKPTQLGDDQPVLPRRNFLKGATLAGAAALAAPSAAGALPAAPQEKLKAALPGPLQIAADTQPPVKDPATQTTSGGDFMVDVFKTLDMNYLAMNCASSFRGLHEAIINGKDATSKSSPARTRRSRSRWRTATPRSKASRWR